MARWPAEPFWIIWLQLSIGFQILAAKRVGMLCTERMEDVAAARVTHEDRFFHVQRADDLECVFRPAVRVVPLLRVIRRTDAAPGERVDSKLVGELGRDGVVHMAG